MSWSLCLVMIINEKEAPNTYIYSLKAYNLTCTCSLLAVVGDMENVDTNILFVCFWPWWWIPLREGHTFVKLHEKSFHFNGDIKFKFHNFYSNAIVETIFNNE